MKKNRKVLFLTLIIGLSTLLFGGVFTLGKYVSSSLFDYYLSSKGFYFSSDYLEYNNTATNVNNLWDLSSTYFNIKNSLNDSVFTDYDISYTTTCSIEGELSNYAKCYLNGSNLSTEDGILSSIQVCNNKTNDNVDVSSYDKARCEVEGYTWVKSISTKEMYFDVVLTNNSYTLDDVVVNVEVKTTSPYKKTLKGTFKLHKKDDDSKLSLSYTSYSNYGNLVISNPTTSNKCITVSFDSDKLLISEDKSKFISYLTDINKYINEFKISVGPSSSINYIFYSRDTNSYDSSIFTMKESDGC